MVGASSVHPGYTLRKPELACLGSSAGSTLALPRKGTWHSGSVSGG